MGYSASGTLNMFRQPPRLSLALTVSILLIGLYLTICQDIFASVYQSRTQGENPKISSSRTASEKSSVSSSSPVGNGTLGFSKIFMLSIPKRTDKRDAITLQAAFTGLDITWREGPEGHTIADKATPPLHYNEDPGAIFTKDGEVGCWRGHMNILSEIIHDGLESALILEDDIDWDVNIIRQAEQVAAASREISARLPKGETTPDVRLDSPYGAGWDILHLGHCSGFAPEDEWSDYHSVIRNDDTVPPSWNMHDLSIDSAKRKCAVGHEGRVDKQNTCAGTYLGKTDRVLQYRGGPQCTYAYAVSQRGARKMLARIGGLAPSDLVTAIDLQMREMCRSGSIQGKGRDPIHCLTLSPPIFLKHHPKGAANMDSDIRLGEGGDREIGETVGVVYSTRLNIEALLAGRPPQSQYVWENNGYRFRKLEEYDTL